MNKKVILPQTARTDKPSQPISSFLQEASNLHVWCIEDSTELNKVGITLDIISELPHRIENCKDAEAAWNSERSKLHTAQKQWKLILPKALELRAELLNTMRFAFRNNDLLLNAVSRISKGNSYSNLIQDLSDIEVLGKKHHELLTKVGCNLLLLNEAASKSKELATVWAQTKSERSSLHQLKLKRNRSYWHLFELVSEIRIAGKFVFRNNKNRLTGYTSTFWKRKNMRRTKPQSEINTDEQLTEIPE